MSWGDVTAGARRTFLISPSLVRPCSCPFFFLPALYTCLHWSTVALPQYVGKKYYDYFYALLSLSLYRLILYWTCRITLIWFYYSNTVQYTTYLISYILPFSNNIKIKTKIVQLLHKIIKIAFFYSLRAFADNQCYVIWDNIYFAIIITFLYLVTI
jgi:hypothetical protein